MGCLIVEREFITQMIRDFNNEIVSRIFVNPHFTRRLFIYVTDLSFAFVFTTLLYRR